MNELKTIINEGDWHSLFQWWSGSKTKSIVLRLLQEISISHLGEISLPEWLSNDEMILPLLGLRAQKERQVQRAVKEVCLGEHHRSFPKFMEYFTHLRLLQVEQMSSTDLSGIEEVTTHTLVIDIKQLEQNLSRITQIKELRVLIVCNGDRQSSLTVKRLCASLPNIEEIYGRLSLGGIFEISSRIRYLSFLEGFFYFSEEAGGFASRLLQAKYPKLPEQEYLNLEYLEPFYLYIFL